MRLILVSSSHLVQQNKHETCRGPGAKGQLRDKTGLLLPPNGPSTSLRRTPKFTHNASNEPTNSVITVLVKHTNKGPQSLTTAGSSSLPRLIRGFSRASAQTLRALQARRRKHCSKVRSPLLPRRSRYNENHNSSTWTLARKLRGGSTRRCCCCCCCRRSHHCRGRGEWGGEGAHSMAKCCFSCCMSWCESTCCGNALSARWADR